MNGEIEKATLFTVSGPIDNPTRGTKEIKVMFNPTTLKVTLANSLKENERSGNSRAAQYVDKSSSSLSVELIFDSSMETDQGTTSEEGKLKEIDTSSDVRKFTGAIANEFMKQADVGDKNAEPKRCMFVWGTFSFVGIMESFDETLDFFSWEGTPLRATVAIKMTESRFQFMSNEAKQAERQTPSLGANSDTPHTAARQPREWRDTSLYNGVEAPRMPSSSALAVPGMSASASLSASMGVSGTAGFSGTMGIPGSATIQGGAGISGGPGGGINATAMMKSTPAFSFGASSSVGTGIPGAFSPNTKIAAGLTAGSIIAARVTTGGTTGNARPGANLRSGNLTASGRASASAGLNGIKASGSLGFD